MFKEIMDVYDRFEIGKTQNFIVLYKDRLVFVYNTDIERLYGRLENLGLFIDSDTEEFVWIISDQENLNLYNRFREKLQPTHGVDKVFNV